MSTTPRSMVERQVRRVRRRLFGRTLLHGLTVGWAAALLCAALWFLIRPFAFADAGDTWRWAVPGILLGLGTLGGIILALTRTPTLVAAALELDDQFALKERVTTLLTLAPQQADTPAGRALLHDVSGRV